MNTKINDPIESEDILRKRKSSQFQLKQYKNSTIIYIYTPTQVIITLWKKISLLIFVINTNHPTIKFVGESRHKGGAQYQCLHAVIRNDGCDNVRTLFALEILRKWGTNCGWPKCRLRSWAKRERRGRGQPRLRFRVDDRRWSQFWQL